MMAQVAPYIECMGPSVAPAVAMLLTLLMTSRVVKLIPCNARVTSQGNPRVLPSQAVLR